MNTHYRKFAVASLILPVCLFMGCASLEIPDPWANPFRAEETDLRSSEVPPSVYSVETETRDRQEQLEQSRIERDVALGMTMNDVAHAWGTPGAVNTAGEPMMGNQQWIYFQGLSSRYGNGSKRVVYFEQGRVAGWETH